MVTYLCHQWCMNDTAMPVQYLEAQLTMDDLLPLLLDLTADLDQTLLKSWITQLLEAPGNQVSIFLLAIFIVCTFHNIHKKSYYSTE